MSTQSKVKTLYSASDVKAVRQALLKEQNGLDALTGLPIPAGQEVCDHCHESQFVRGILHRQTNAVLGKLENMYIRYLKWWYKGTLSEFLRNAASYLEKKHKTEYVHPGWIKRVNADFNKLKANHKDIILNTLGAKPSSNDFQRKAKFKELILTKRFDYITIRDLLQEVKEINET